MFAPFSCSSSSALGTATASWEHGPIFSSRATTLCSGRGDNIDGEIDGPCSRKVGNGLCNDNEGNTYDFCFTVSGRKTLEECRFQTEIAVGAIGMEYLPNGGCNILFEDGAEDLVCPDGLLPLDDFVGTGFIADAAGDSSVQCYSCDNVVE